MTKAVTVARTIVPMVLGLALGACSAATQKGPRTLEITSHACSALAQLYDQPEMAQVCEQAEDAAPLIEELFKRAKAAKGCGEKAEPIAAGK
jgi:hypothetical protein